MASVLTIAVVCTLALYSQPADQWWKSAVIYEIYPRSFGDTNGDGIGDLNGITARLDYIKDLGVDAVWITPFFPSPQVDFGYDISDYTAVDPQYGTMADFDRLLAEAQKRGIRVICDLVVNHSSDKHPWFTESRSSRANPKADWYIWRDGKPGNQPPNNWQSIFGHSAWQFDAARGQYYYHAFYTEQPDLNWANPEVRKAMYDAMRFWMKRGVSGFRLDAVTSMYEDPQLRDEPAARPGTNAYGDPILTREYTDNLPALHSVLQEMRRVTDEFPGRILIGETYLPNIAELAKMYGEKNDETQLPMNTQFAFNPLSAAAFRQKLLEAETKLNGNLPLLFLNNHDNRRSWSRYGDGKNDAAIAKMMATLLLTPRAVPLLYYGEELGMENTDPVRVEDVRDPIGKLGWPKEKGRDGERTPMQWDATANAGFSAARETWLPVAPSYKLRNATAEAKDPASMLNYYKSLIRLKKTTPALRDGDFVMLNENDPSVLAFLRIPKAGKPVLVALNFTGMPQTVTFDLKPQGIRATKAAALLSSYGASGASSALSKVVLPGYGALVAEVE